MTHFGIICPASTGHLNPMCALGRELQRRGHRVILFGILDTQPKALAAGLDFRAIGEEEFPTGWIAQRDTQQGKLSGFAGMRYSISWVQQIIATFLREGEEAMREVGVEALLVDQLSPDGATVAEFLNLPFVSVCSALLVNREDSVPPIYTPWRYNTSWFGCLRNRAGYALLDRLTQPVWKVLNEYRQ